MAYLQPILKFVRERIGTLIGSAIVTGTFILVAGTTPGLFFADEWRRHHDWLFTGQARLVVILIGLVVIAVPIYLRNFRNESNTKSASVSAQSVEWWEWPTLSDIEINLLCAQLNNYNPSRDIWVSGYSSSIGLRDSFHVAFARLGWNHHVLADARMIHRPTIGVSISPSSADADTLKRAIETCLNIGVQLTAPHAPGAQTMLIVGARPLPVPLPQSAKDEISDLGRRMVKLSGEIYEFSSDREGLHQKTYKPPEPAAGVSAGLSEWREHRAFTNESEAIYERKYGVRAKALLVELERIAVGLPFPMSVTSSNFKPIAKWFGVIGELITQLQMNDARSRSADSNFWFHEH